jgi:2-hydroxychromene-2-carboxylate isomerase
VAVVDLWFDPVSPYAHLAFERLPEALEGVSVDVRYRPVLFAAMLRHHAHKGPAEIEPKRAWTFRQVDWLARVHRVRLERPAEHPFNPLPLLRLLWATAPDGLTPSRFACETVLRHVWEGGASATDPERLRALAAALEPRLDPEGEPARRRLREATDAAVAAGVFGVPTLGAEGRLFWGFDALPMLRAMLRGEPSFDAEAWERAGERPPGVVRRQT